MTARLDMALAFAQLGVPVFPLAENSKVPREGSHGKDEATIDPATIERWWAKYPQGNVGVVPGPLPNGQHLFILDLDRKKGKDGIVFFQTWCKANGVEYDALCRSTLVVGTCHGGLQMYFTSAAPVKHGVGVFGAQSGVDTRANRKGYGIAPESIVDGKLYTLLNDADDFAPAPAALIEAIGLDASGQTKERSATKPVALPVNETSAINRASYYLLNEAPVAEEGKGGDHTTFTVAARVRDQGVNESDCLQLMVEHWNTRCVPPWMAEELRKKVENAYRYGANPQGSAAPEADFAGVPVTDTKPATPHLQPYHPDTSRIGDIFTQEPPSPRFIVDGFYPVACGQENSVGGRGKTTRQQWEAVHIILGRPLYGRTILKAGPVLVVTKEDGIDIFKHRLHHVTRSMEFSDSDKKLVAHNFHVLDLTGDVGGRLVEVDRDGNLQATNLAERIYRGYRHEGIAQIIFDPWNGFSPGERFVNDAEAALMVAGSLLSRELACCVRFTCHVSKDVARRGIIDSHSGRGGSAMGDNARFVFSYIQHDVKEETTWKAVPTSAEQAAARGDLYRLHMTKQSYAKCCVEPIWIERQGYAFTVHEGPPVTPETTLAADGDHILAFVRRELDQGAKYSSWGLAEQSKRFSLPRDRARTVITWLQASNRIIERPLPEKERVGKRTHYLEPAADNPVEPKSPEGIFE